LREVRRNAHTAMFHLADFAADVLFKTVFLTSVCTAPPSDWPPKPWGERFLRDIDPFDFGVLLFAAVSACAGNGLLTMVETLG
jgi:hypothetical protein